MKTYKGLVNDYFTRNKRLEKIAWSLGRRHLSHHDFWATNTYIDQIAAMTENSELFDYQLRRAY